MIGIIVSIWLSVGVIAQWLGFLFKSGKNANDWHYLIMVLVVALWATLKMESIMLFGLIGIFTGVIHAVIETQQQYKKIQDMY